MAGDLRAHEPDTSLSKQERIVFLSRPGFNGAPEILQPFRLSSVTLSNRASLRVRLSSCRRPIFEWLTDMEFFVHDACTGWTSTGGADSAPCQSVPGIGPLSMIGASALRRTFVSRKDWPRALRSTSPSGPRALNFMTQSRTICRRTPPAAAEPVRHPSIVSRVLGLSARQNRNEVEGPRQAACVPHVESPSTSLGKLPGVNLSET